MTEAIEVFQKLAAAEYAPAFGTESEAASERQMRLAAHRTWLRSIPHEILNPEHAYRVGIYIRYFNQTRYDNYLDYHIQQYRDTLAMCPDWSLVDFYIDEGATAPNMETAPEWSRLLQDALDGKVDLIITQKVSNVSKKDYEIAFVARILAALDKPVGIYFVSEDIFTLASYYRSSLRDEGFFPSEDWSILPEPEQKALSPGGEDTAYIE